MQRLHGIGVRPERYSATKGRTTSLETLLVIDHVVRNTDVLGDAASIVDIVEANSSVLHGRACRRASQPALVPELHGEADDVIPSARSMAATVEESTPPDMATAMVGVKHVSPRGERLLLFPACESLLLVCFALPKKYRASPVQANPGRSSRQHLVIRHVENPITISVVGTLQVIGGRNDQAKIIENENVS